MGFPLSRVWDDKDYIKKQGSISTPSIAVCTMERHQAGQEEALVEVMVETDSLNISQRGRGSPADRCGRIKRVVALVSVIGLVMTALVAGFILYFFMFTPSCNQDGPQVNIYNLTESGERGRYDIFTVDKAATYLIYGRVKLSNATGKEVTLMHMWNEINVPIQKKIAIEAEIFFFAEVKLVNSSKISIYFESAYDSSTFLVYEL